MSVFFINLLNPPAIFTVFSIPRSLQPSFGTEANRKFQPRFQWEHKGSPQFQTTSPSHLQLTERKSFNLVYSGLVWLVIPLIMIGLQVIGRGAGWMDKPNAQDLAGQVGKPDAFITMAFKATHFITQNLPGFLWIPTGILISALSSWLLWKIIRKDTNELVLTKPNPEQFNLTAANP